MSQRRSWTLLSGLLGSDGTLPYDETGIEGLIPQIVDLEATLVLLEATGGLELPLVAALAAAALPVVVVNPRPVRDFAKATGTLANTDTLDAGVLAHFADAVRPEVRPLKDAETQVLNSLTARRHQVMTMLASEKNRLGTAIGAVSPRIEARGPVQTHQQGSNPWSPSQWESQPPSRKSF